MPRPWCQGMVGVLADLRATFSVEMGEAETGAVSQLARTTRPAAELHPGLMRSARMPARRWDRKTGRRLSGLLPQSPYVVRAQSQPSAANVQVASPSWVPLREHRSLLG